ncbi:MAG: hypothetical protein QXU67_01390 [Candidatus Bathyarchaeia archaeon]
MAARRKLMGLILVLIALLVENVLPFNPLKASSDQVNFSIVDVTVRSSSGSPKVYPGSRRASLRIEAIYLNDMVATLITGRLKTVEGIDFSAGSSSSTQARSLNGSIALRVEKGEHLTFDYYLDISKSLNPGNYNLILNITYRLENSTTIFSEEHNVSITIFNYPEIQLRIIDAYLSPVSCPGAVSTNLYILMENAGESNIDSADFEVTLPASFTVREPKARAGAISSSGRFTITFSGISVPQNAIVGTYYAVVYVDATMRTEDNVDYHASTNIRVYFEITNPPKEDPIVISAVSVLYQGSPAPLLPSANGATIRIVLVNRLPETVGSMIVTPMPPSGVTMRAISGTYTNGMTPGGSCFIDMTVNIDPNVQIGKLVIPISISYVRIVSGASYISEQDLSILVSVESYHSYVPELSLVSAFWGSPNPIPVYAGSQYVPLTLRFINDGRYDIVGGVVRVDSEFLRPIKNSEALAARLTPGSYSSITLYFDIGVEAGNIPLNITANYVFDDFGVHLNFTRKFKVYLPVEIYSALDSNLMVISSGWQNNYNVFPRTENATFQVTLTNRAPFSVGGIILSLSLPENMSSRGDKIAKAYIEGPVRSLSTFTASFMISVAEILPGKYNATLTADFILLSGGAGIRCVEKFVLTLSINDDSQAVEFVSSKWYEGSVGPNTYGTHLLISLRNNYVDSMRGAVLELSLPDGMLNALDNTSHIKVSPLSAGFPGITQPLQTQDLSALISTYLESLQVSQTQTFSRGDTLTFIANIHVLNVSLGFHNLDGSLSYIDQWGTRRSVKVVIPVAVLGRTEYIEVSMNGSLSVKSRFTNISLKIRNVGSSPLYDVYLIISPYQSMPILIASPTITRLSVIGANETVAIPITLAYNPLGFMSQIGGTTLITHGPVPMMISVVYRDSSGAFKSFNNTITVVIEPFIDLAVKDVSAIGKTSQSTVTGTIVNLGSATAYRVNVIFRIENASKSVLIGDIAPGDELAFRIDLPRFETSGTLRIEYFNIFDELNFRELPVNIEMLPEIPVTPPAKEGLGFEEWIVIGAVIVFLSFAAILIYKVLRARSSSGA